MSSLIFNGKVIDSGDITEDVDKWVGQKITYKASFGSAFLVSENPPHESEWGYSEGNFIDLGKIKEDEKALAQERFEAALMNAKIEKREELKKLRDEKIAEPVNNVQVSRITDRENIQGTIANWDTLGLGETINWIMLDNTVQALSKADLEAIYIGYGLRKAQCFNLYEQAIAALNSANTIEEIEAVNFGSE